MPFRTTTVNAFLRDHLPADLPSRLVIAASTAAAFASAFWASLGLALQALVLLMTLDLASGLLAALYEGKLDSRVGRRGLTRKLMVLVVIGTFAVLQPSFGGVPLAQWGAGFYAVIEALSVLENAIRCGVPVPSFVRDHLAALRTRVEKGAPLSAPATPLQEGPARA